MRRTWRYRPDLLLKAQLSEAERYLLAKFAEEDARRCAEHVGTRGREASLWRQRLFGTILALYQKAVSLAVTIGA